MSNMSNIIRHASDDKFDAYMPNVPNFIHSGYNVSSKEESFIISSGYIWANGYDKKGQEFGTQKKMWKISGQGIMIDYRNIGKSDK